jgi:hypothetical protein
MGLPEPICLQHCELGKRKVRRLHRRSGQSPRTLAVWFKVTVDFF